MNPLFLFEEWSAITKEILAVDQVPKRMEYKSYSEFLDLHSKMRMKPKDLERLLELDSEYGETYALRELDYNRKILNLEEEQKIFFEYLEKGRKYNPIFEHNPEPYTRNGMLVKAKKLQDKFKLFDCYLSKFYVERLQFILDYGEAMMMDKDTPAYRDKIYQIFTPPEPDLVQKAEEIIQENPYEKVSSSERTIDANEMGERIEKVLNNLGYDKWKVKIVSSITPRMNVKDEYIVNINQSATFSEDDFKGLVEHEIKGHVGRRWYGDKTGLTLFRNGLMGKNEFDEGLAIYNSIYNVENPKPNILFNISFYVVMCNQIPNLDFYGLFQFGKKYLNGSEKKLFSKIARMKRVCHDTSALVGDLYESDYLRGFLKVKNLNDRERLEIKKFNIGPVNYQFIDEIKVFLTVNGFIDKNF